MIDLADAAGRTGDANPRGAGGAARPLLAQRILVLDGAMGTLIQSYQLDEAGFRGATRDSRDHPRDLRGDNDLLSLTQPGDRPGDPRRLPRRRRRHHRDEHVHRDAASPRPTTASRAIVREMNAAAARIAREAADAARGAPSPTVRASSPARSGRRTGPPRSRRTSTTRAPATSRSTSWPRPTRRPPRA